MSLRLHGDTLARPGMLDFATCLWRAPPPAALIAALARGLNESARYPDERSAREQIAVRHGRQPEEVLLLNGACEAFWLLAHALRPLRAACVHPSPRRHSERLGPRSSGSRSTPTLGRSIRAGSPTRPSSS